jgi:hypothetical protein
MCTRGGIAAVKVRGPKADFAGAVIKKGALRFSRSSRGGVVTLALAPHGRPQVSCPFLRFRRLFTSLATEESLMRTKVFSLLMASTLVLATLPVAAAQDARAETGRP